MKKDKRTKEYKQERLFAGRVHDSFALRKELIGRGYDAFHWDYNSNSFIVVHVTSGGRVQYFGIEFKATFLGEIS